ncbi:MAG: GAF and ANTAR domain-containing protein [Actinobacteria bacterium]|nr:GAF and ANTAR domain-containing protein [Actinomycetota bacterium]
MGDAARLRALLSAYARTTIGRYDIGDVLYRLTDQALAAVGVDGVGVSVADASGRLRFVSATDQMVVRIEERQVESGDGPCHDAFRTRDRIVVDDLRELVGHRWGDYPAFAVEHGCLALAALPMVVDDEAVGALDVYRRGAGPWDHETLEDAQLVADVATGLVVNHRTLEDSQRLAEQLQGALDSRIVIEQAKGILVEQRGGDMGDAFQHLRDHARRRQRKLRDVARHVVEHRGLPDD